MLNLVVLKEVARLFKRLILKIKVVQLMRK
jgi:hypothetical protein